MIYIRVDYVFFVYYKSLFMRLEEKMKKLQRQNIGYEALWVAEEGDNFPVIKAH